MSLFLSPAFIVILLALNPQIADILAKPQYTKLINWFVVVIVALFIAYLSAPFIALWRGGLSPWLVLDIMMTNEKGLLINEAHEHEMLYFEIGNMMLGGLYSTIVQVRERITALFLGANYGNYFLITPPACLDLPRPLGLEWATGINGAVMTQGGLFEVAEAYWNFGLLGCFFVSLFIPSAFGWLLQRCLKASNAF